MMKQTFAMVVRIRVRGSTVAAGGVRQGKKVGSGGSGPPEPGEDLKPLAEMGGVEELEEGGLPGARPAGLRFDGRGENPGGVPQEERLLGVDRSDLESVPPEGVRDPVPAHVAGQVLLSGPGQEVGLLAVPVEARAVPAGAEVASSSQDFP